MIGVPAIATHMEFESVKDSANEQPEPGGHTMAEFMQSAIAAVRLSTIGQESDPSFLGLSIWALHPEGGLHGPADTKWYYPSIIGQEMWNLLATPVFGN